MNVNKKSVYHTKNLDHDYFEKQIINPYESTKQFFKFLNINKPRSNPRIPNPYMYMRYVAHHMIISYHISISDLEKQKIIVK